MSDKNIDKDLEILFTGKVKGGRTELRELKK